VKKAALASLVLALTLPAFAQTPDPTAPAPPPPEPATPKSSIGSRFFFGGGVGASFGTIDYVEIAPLVGFRVVPRFDLGLQPFYRWTDDGRYSPSISTTDYGANIFARVRIVQGFFGEADYQHTNYEYPNSAGGTTRDTYNAFLAGGGYTVPLGKNAGLYFSALYDFTYDGNDPNRPYDSPVRFQIGASVGF